GGEKYPVRCKRGGPLKVGVAVIRECYGARAVEGAAGGFGVIPGRFTKEAQDFASGRNIQSIDGPILKQWIAQHKSQPSNAPPAPTTLVTPEQPQVPSCPQCNAPMIKRTAKRGANAGNVFWGCSEYPRCRAIVSI